MGIRRWRVFFTATIACVDSRVRHLTIAHGCNGERLLSHTSHVAFFSLLLATLAGCPAKDATEKPKDQEATKAPTLVRQSPPEDESMVDSAQTPGRIHLVEPKDTLLHLAERYYRDRNQWRRIWQANRNRISNPNDLPVGMKLIIP